MKLDSQMLVVADPEAFYLPHFIAKMAKAGRVSTIVVRHRKTDFITKYRDLKRNIDAFGLYTLMIASFCIILARVADLVFRDKYYSIEKVAKRFNLNIFYVKKIHDESFYNIIKQEDTRTTFSQVAVKLKAELLEKGKFINRHCGLLPSYAGVNPVFWALLTDEEYLGITLHIMNEGYDAGEILKQGKIKSKGHTFFSAYHQLFDLGAELFLQLLNDNNKDTPDLALKRSYYSWPDRHDRKNFARKGYRFGIPFRLHPSIKP
ncbi:MAG: hypothetical protein HQ580_15855 [Planctomycetes bacterium]|nr:hypothetical protein [Planctomycetota bacterium]